MSTRRITEDFRKQEKEKGKHWMVEYIFPVILPPHWIALEKERYNFQGRFPNTIVLAFLEQNVDSSNLVVFFYYFRINSFSHQMLKGTSIQWNMILLIINGVLSQNIKAYKHNLVQELHIWFAHRCACDTDTRWPRKPVTLGGATCSKLVLSLASLASRLTCE